VDVRPLAGITKRKTKSAALALDLTTIGQAIASTASA
jgi:hypothetical protein